jgi:hypothetical protein
MAGLSVSASVLIHLTFDEMTQQSSAILLGRCVEVRSVWSADRRQIYTENVFEVNEYYKGDLGRRVVISEPGGEIGNMVYEVSGVPRFEVGEQAVLFVWTGPSGRHQVIGFTQGKFAVERDSAGMLNLRQAVNGEPMLEPPSHPPHDAERLALPLSALRPRVEALLSRQGVRQ